MNKEELEQIKADSQKMLGIIEKNRPFEKNAAQAYSSDAVKDTIRELSQFAVSDYDELQDFLGWMEKNDFYKSPASSRFHGDFEGGLALHSLKVAHQALKFAPFIIGDFLDSKYCADFTFTATDIFIAAIAHDFCKAGFYTVKTRNTKDIFGNWTKANYFTVRDDNRNLGHGNESVLKLLESMPGMIRKRAVLEAISRHMGFSDITETEKINYSNFMQNPLVVLIQIADQTASAWHDL